MDIRPASGNIRAEMQTEKPPFSTKQIGVTAMIWLAVAGVAGALGVLARLPVPGPQIVLASLTGLLVLAFWKVPRFHAWVMTVDVRLLVGFHLTRLVGFYFLHLHSLGKLPYDFAVPGGVGDIAVAFTALVAMAAPKGEVRFKIYRLWNILGLADILMVVWTAARLALKNPASMQELTHLPLSLLITFVVPIIIATHIFIFARLREMKHETGVQNP